MTGYYVEIVRYVDDGVERRLGPFQSMREADKADSGVNINLNHDEFYTAIKFPDLPVQQITC